jgi:hypothetical protein
MQTDSYKRYIYARATEAKYAQALAELYEVAGPIVEWLEDDTAIDNDLVVEFVATYRKLDMKPLESE